MSDRNAPDLADSSLPDAYTNWRHSTLGRITDELEERLLLEQLGPTSGLRILDVGCGDGVLAARLAQEGALVTGLDASADILAAARRRMDATGVEVDLVEGDAGELPFSAERFDRVVSVAALCFVEDPSRPIREMVRLLKLGGRLILGELGRWNLWAAQRRMKGWLDSRVWRAAHFRSRGGLVALAGRAGLQDVAVAGAVFYPPLGLAAKLLAPLDPWMRRRTSAGAAFLVLRATKPPIPRNNRELP